jgi:hypothetical protein
METKGVDGPRVSQRPVEPQRTEKSSATTQPAKETAATQAQKPSDKYTGETKQADYSAISNQAQSKAGEGNAVESKAVGGTWETIASAATDPTKAADEQKLKEMKEILAKSPTGAEALKYIEDNKIPVKFADGGGSYWNGKEIVIDRSKSAESAALTLVHEAGHAKADRTDTSGDIKNQTREKYVETMINEESAATVDAIQTKNELVKAGVDVKRTYPLEKEYNAAYKAAVEQAKKDNPKATEAELDAIGQKAGLDRVRQGFEDGEVVTSTNGKTYPEYYGGAWDNVHKNDKKPEPTRPESPSPIQ